MMIAPREWETPFYLSHCPFWAHKGIILAANAEDE